MSDDTAKVLELIQIGFSVSIDATEHKDNIEEILEAARMFNTTLVLRNMPDSLLEQKSLKKLKTHSNKIIIET